MANCKECLYNHVCELWRESECQDANSCLTGGLSDCTLYKPTADVVEVVRCKDCTEFGICPISYFYLKLQNGFCSKGKKDGAKMDGNGEKSLLYADIDEIIDSVDGKGDYDV